MVVFLESGDYATCDRSARVDVLKFCRWCALLGVCALMLACGQEKVPMDDPVPDPVSAGDFAAEDRERLARVTMPVFVAEGLQMEVSGGTSGDGVPVTSLSLTHWGDEHGNEGVEVYVNSEADAGDLSSDPQEHLAYRLGDDTNSIKSTSRKLRVDGVERSFAFATAEDRWAAVGQADGVTITVEASGIEPDQLHLRSLADPTQATEPNPEYRAQRLQLDVLDTRRVTELAEGTSLAGVGAPLAEAAKPALALLDSDQDAPSWFGGTPQLPADLRWPEGEYGPMLFVAQISLADLDPAVWTGPAAGHLHVFCDADDESGAIEGFDACTVVHSGADAVIRERPFPADLHEDKRLPRFPVKPQAGLSLPVAATPLLRRLGIELRESSEYDELWTLQQRLESEQGWHDAPGQLLGWDRIPGEDLMAIFASEAGGRPEDWTLLLHTDVLDADLYVALPAADLTAGRFSRVQAGLFFD